MSSPVPTYLRHAVPAIVPTIQSKSEKSPREASEARITAIIDLIGNFPKGVHHAKDFTDTLKVNAELLRKKIFPAETPKEFRLGNLDKRNLDKSMTSIQNSITSYQKSADDLQKITDIFTKVLSSDSKQYPKQSDKDKLFLEIETIAEKAFDKKSLIETQLNTLATIQSKPIECDLDACEVITNSITRDYAETIISEAKLANKEATTFSGLLSKAWSNLRLVSLEVSALQNLFHVTSPIFPELTEANTATRTIKDQLSPFENILSKTQTNQLFSYPMKATERQEALFATEESRLKELEEKLKEIPSKHVTSQQTFAGLSSQILGAFKQINEIGEALNKENAPAIKEKFDKTATTVQQALFAATKELYLSEQVTEKTIDLLRGFLTSSSTIGLLHLKMLKQYENLRLGVRYSTGWNTDHEIKFALIQPEVEALKNEYATTTSSLQAFVNQLDVNSGYMEKEVNDILLNINSIAPEEKTAFESKIQKQKESFSGQISLIKKDLQDGLEKIEHLNYELDSYYSRIAISLKANEHLRVKDFREVGYISEARHATTSAIYAAASWVTSILSTSPKEQPLLAIDK
ncbi:MAG: hypothetical protein WCG42_00665 [Parachlamydiaceae bacterium]